MREGRPVIGLGAKGFALHSFADTHSAPAGKRPRGRILGLFPSSAGEVCPFAAASAGDFVFNMGRHSPARKAGMTEAHRQVGGAGHAGHAVIPAFFVAQTPRGFEDKSKMEGVQT